MGGLSPPKTLSNNDLGGAVPNFYNQRKRGSNPEPERNGENKKKSKWFQIYLWKTDYEQSSGAVNR